MANGFLECLDLNNRSVQVLPFAGGGGKVLDQFETELIAGLDKFPSRLVLLLLDFDEQKDRLQKYTNRIPLELRHRVFILGPWDEPKDLKRELRMSSLTQIGKRLAEECVQRVGITCGLMTCSATTYQREIDCVNQFKAFCLSECKPRLEEVCGSFTWAPNIWMGVSMEDEREKWWIGHLVIVHQRPKFP